MPSGAGALFTIQIFSTLSYSVLYSTLILYATQGLHLSDLYSTSITGSFIALNYFLHLLGGYIGGRYLSYRSLFCLAMLAQMIGCALISIPEKTYLLWGLSVFLSGSGLNITCINCLVTQLFEPDDKRRESAFLWNYSGMNIGFFIGFYLAGHFQLQQAYQQLFLLSAVGNAIALALTLYNWKILEDRDTTYVNTHEDIKRRMRYIGIALIVTLIFALRILLKHTDLCNDIIIIIGFAMLGLITTLTLKQPVAKQRQKMWAFIILALCSVIFWALYQLAPMGLNLFIQRNVDRHLLGFMIAPQWVQNINTIVIIIGGPVLSFVFSELRDRGVNINIPLQFSIALMLIGISLSILPIGIHFADVNGLVNFNWILASYGLLSLGELFLSPVGYAMVGQLAPVRLRGLMMGMWMMITGVAAIMSSYFSKIAIGNSLSTNPLATNPEFSHTFGMLGLSSIGAGILLFIAVPLVSKLCQEKTYRSLKQEDSPDTEHQDQLVTVHNDVA
ncbi:MAG: MFS transporter [Gammaproteobacteria bacterium RIFCSPHIGHO2_12_FULL_45_12]|nr:MAG: MFS transporter [Gammaproteobacteria bacterium RIFCSPHIGHO2_12_FULL_45_12]